MTKLKSNGFGSFEKHLIFSVTEPHAKKLKQMGWEVVGEHVGGTEFKYSFTGRRKGDDESALWQLGHVLPETVPDNCWRVCWERSYF